MLLIFAVHSTRYCHDTFTTKFQSTIGVDFVDKIVTVGNQKDIKIRLRIVIFTKVVQYQTVHNNTRRYSDSDNPFAMFCRSAMPNLDLGHGRTGALSHHYSVFLQTDPRRYSRV